MTNKKLDTGHIVVIIVVAALTLSCIALPILACLVSALMA